MKVNRFKVGAVLTACMAALVAASCGSDDNGGGGSGDEAFAKLKPGEASVYCVGPCKEALRLTQKARDASCKVGVSWSDTSFPYGAAAISRSKKTAAGFPNMELTTTDARGDAATQSSQVDDLIARGVDVLILSPADAKALAPAAKRATDAGIKVIASDRNVDSPVSTYIGSDNVEAGRVGGKYIVDTLGGKGNVVELQGSLGASPTIDRNKGFEEALQGSDIKVIASETADYARDKGLQVMENLLQRFGAGKIDAVFTHNDEMSLGAIQAIKEAGRQDEIKVVGVDGQQSALRAIEAGQYAATVVYPLPVPEHILAAAKLCAGEKLPARIKQANPLATADNVAKFDGTTF
ncbi:MAG: ribose transport system substrate-binding protein [Thermoleophilaceae bacterium]|nr:ribose transport system substrate-binding protein [Thermoleophilaceae bacterium]